MLATILVGAPIAIASDRQWPTWDAIEHGPPSESAKCYLTPEAGATITGRQIERDQMLPDGVRLRFSTKPQSAGRGLCRREQYQLSAMLTRDGRIRAIGDDEAKSRPQLKLGVVCPEIEDSLFATVHPGSSVDEAASILGWLNDVRATALRGANPSAEISCESEPKPDRCLEGARGALARLPLEKTFAIGRARGRPESWELFVTETKPGDAVWTVIIDRSLKEPLIEMRWHYPAPF